ncbi:hypothetical protein FPOAC2_13765 [Fusarium poae]
MDGPSSIEELTRLLREAEQRAEEERQRAEREQQRAEGAERERQEERQRAEREQQRAEEAERERQEERQRAEREQQRAEEAERERQEERQRAEREQQRAEEAEEHTRLTTLDEYIAACHDSVFSRFAIETDPKLTSKGPPWPNFLHQQRVTFGTLHHSFPTESRLFENRNFLAGMGNRVSQRPIGDEKTLEYFLHNSVEDPVRAIVQQLKQVEEVGRDFQIGDGVVFENHPHALSDVAEEVVERETPSTPPRTPDHGIDLNQLRPDQICVYRSDNTPSSQRTMVYVSE